MHDSLDRIHDASMTLLENTGIRIHHPQILEKLAQKGIHRQGDRLFFTQKQIEELVAKAPSSFTLHAPDPAFNMEIGGDTTYYAAGYGCPSVFDRDGVKRPATFEDYHTFLKLVESSPFFHLNGGILVQPSDLPAEHSAPLMLRTAILNSRKCLMGFPGHKKEMETLMEMMCIAKGGQKAFMEKPQLITLINATSPMQFDSIALETMETCAHYHQPVIITPGPIAGATGPITLAGTTALGHAEALAGIAITQLLREGTPVVYGLQATIADMATGSVSVGAPGYALLAQASARLAKRLNLPCRTGGAGSDACGPTPQSGYEAMMVLMVSRQEKINLVIHSAGILDGFGAMGEDKFLTDLETISMVEYLEKGFGTTDDELALDVTEAASKGAAILAHPHTLKNCRTTPWNPAVSWRGPLKGRTGQEAFYARLDTEKERLLNTFTPPSTTCGMQLDTFLESSGIPASLLAPLCPEA
ncbi:MAG: trimethylamine methyltransferase family protein [Desulfobacterales bacterium]|nr:trimethylamine methyltransferase family protein [Desulfobacterales bacterium]